jgi:hypothetical protein
MRGKPSWEEIKHWLSEEDEFAQQDTKNMVTNVERWKKMYI